MWEGIGGRCREALLRDGLTLNEWQLVTTTRGVRTTQMPTS